MYGRRGGASRVLSPPLRDARLGRRPAGRTTHQRCDFAQQSLSRRLWSGGVSGASWCKDSGATEVATTAVVLVGTGGSGSLIRRRPERRFRVGEPGP